MTERKEATGQMTREELRIRVAELRGWKPYDGIQTIAYMWAPGHISNVVPKWTRTVDDTVDFLIDLPDYPSDLNACHSFEETLTEEQRVEYCIRLHEIVRRGKTVGDGIKQWENIHATAEQRCRAFIATMEASQDAREGNATKGH